MSPLEAIDAVMRSRLPPTDRLVLMCWARHVDAHGCSRAGPSMLVDETGASVKTCKRVLARLRASGVLVYVRDHATKTATYRVDRLDLDSLAKVGTPQGQSDPRGTVTPGSEGPPGQRVPTPRVRESLPPGSESPPMEDKKEDKKEDKVSPVLVEPQPQPAKVDGWTVLAEAYGSLPGKRRPNNRKVGNGKHIATLLGHHGLDLALTVIRWWAYDSTPDSRAAFLRKGDHGLPTLATAKNLDAYAEMADAWKARGAPGDPDASPEVRARGRPTRTLAEQRAIDEANRPPPLIRR